MYQTLAIDALDVLQDFVGTNHIGRSQFDMKRAIISAVDVVSQECRWHYNRSHYTFETDAPYSTGTITWNASNRQWALSGGTFPTWAQFGTLHVESVGVGEVQQRINDTSIEMPADTSFGDQTHSAVSYTLFRDRYRLPFAVRQVGEPIEFTSGWNPKHVDLGQLLHHRAVSPQTGTPIMYSLARDSTSSGTTVIYLYPAPDTATLWSMTVNRAPRQIFIWGTEADATTGTVVADTSLRYLAGTSVSWSNFDAKHIGAVVRWGISTTQLPTGPEGDYPYREQQVIIATSGTTNLWMPQEPAASESGVRFRISDPIDLEPGALQAFWTRCKLELCRQRPKEHAEILAVLERDYVEKIALARKVAGYRREPILHGGGRSVYRRLSSFPSGADISE